MKVVIFGVNDIATLASFYLQYDSEHSVAAFCVDGTYLKQNKLLGLPVVDFETCLKDFPPTEYKFFAPLYDNRLRAQKYNEIKQEGYQFISYVSSKATVWSEVGENCFVMEDNTIQPFVQMGNNIVFWSGNHIGHHSVIRDNIFFSSHVVLSGHCLVNSFCWLGVNSTIRDHVELGEGSFIAMSASVTKNTKPYKKYKGIPAKECGDVEKIGQYI